MEVVDDMNLGKIVKQSGFSFVRGYCAQDFVVVRWHAGLGNLVRGVTKISSRAWATAWRCGDCHHRSSFFSERRASFFGIFVSATGGFAISSNCVGPSRPAFHAGVDIDRHAASRGRFMRSLTSSARFSSLLLLSSARPSVNLKQGWHHLARQKTFYPLDDLKRGVV